MGRAYKNEVGDDITRAEYAALVAQNLLRRWTVLMVITAVSIFCWSMGYGVATDWNYGASFYAVALEQMTFMVVIGMQRRDSKVLRKMAAVEESTARMEEEHGTLLTQIAEKLGINGASQ